LSDIHSDRFTFTGLTYSQCVSPVCRFHTESGTRLDAFRYRCGLEYRVTTLTSVLARGKVWPGALSACPLDGSPTTSLVSMDCLKFLSARGRDGAFTTGGVNGLEPQWDTLVILAPYADTRGEGELRRYDIGVGDLLAGLVVSSGNSPIDAAVPDMIRLFDFGTDGTTNGIPDGLVPVTAATSDAERESFFAGTYLGEAAVIITKNLGSPTTYPRRVLNLVVRLRDGFTTFSVGHNESAMVFWTASCTFTREPTVLVNKLTEFTASTAASNPFNAMTNPDGISDSSVVRMTLATTDNWISKGESLWNHSVQELVLKPRN